MKQGHVPPGDLPRGGPAFRMTLRDYFAAKAMAGFCGFHDTAGNCTVGRAKDVVVAAYQYADAMLVERAKK